MAYSANLQRNIEIQIEDANRFDEAEIDAAISALPGYPETMPHQVREAAEQGDINALFVVDAAYHGDPVAQEWC